SVWFENLDARLIDKIANLSTTRVYRKGATLFERNEPGDYLYGVISGRILISIRSIEGKELSLNTALAGDIGGEIAVLDGGLRTATGVALEETLVFVIHRDAFTPLLLEEPAIALNLIGILCERVRHTSRQVEDYALLPAKTRLACRLYSLVIESGQDMPCTVMVSQTELASFLNVTRQVVNGVLQELQAEGYVELGRNRIHIEYLEDLIPTDRTLS
ncbi:MAG: Crp/Fnr family transcriptional regulator, partial [Pseudomonadota bacterium]